MPNMTKDECITVLRILRDELAAAPQTNTGNTMNQADQDNATVDAFAAEMKVKLAVAREKGRGGWQTADQATLSSMLHEHVNKGDPRDVANFCMFLHHLGFDIAPLADKEPKPAAPSEILDALDYHWLSGTPVMRINQLVQEREQAIEGKHPIQLARAAPTPCTASHVCDCQEAGVACQRKAPAL